MPIYAKKPKSPHRLAISPFATPLYRAFITHTHTRARRHFVLCAHSDAQTITYHIYSPLLHGVGAMRDGTAVWRTCACRVCAMMKTKYISSRLRLMDSQTRRGGAPRRPGVGRPDRDNKNVLTRERQLVGATPEKCHHI